MDQGTVCCEHLEHSDFVALLSISSLALALMFVRTDVGISLGCNVRREGGRQTRTRLARVDS
jgi:hypothetical protein